MRTLLACLLGLGGAICAAPVPANPSDETVAELSALIPNRKYLPHGGTVVGVVVSDVAAAMGRDGRSGPPDAMGFSVSGSSYNWMYCISTDTNPLITNLQVRVGEDGKAVQIYPKLDMIRAKTLVAHEIQAAHFLAEIEVNDGKGCPADEAFVATKIKRIDGTKTLRLDVAASVKFVTERFKTDAEKTIDAETWEKARKNALGDRKATGPKENQDILTATWLPDSKRLRVTVVRTVTDGDYKFGGGGANLDPPALPPPGAKPGAQPAPPRLDGVRWGTQFGVQYARAYEFNTDGNLVATKTFKPKEIKAELPPPPQEPRGPFPLPPLPPPPVKKGE